MTAYRVSTPVKGVTTTVAGVRLVDGVGVVDGEEHPSTLAYFRRHGYRVEEIPADEPAPKAPADPVEPVTPAGPPARGASKDAWVAYVTSEAAGEKRLGLDEATALKRDELAEQVLGPKED